MALSNPFAPDTACQGILARSSDLQTSEWKQAFARCESVSSELMQCCDRWLTPDYPWRLDPLHCWSRLWEYPFALSALESITDARPLNVIDVGSGANFFMPLLAGRGHRIHGVDMDPKVVGAGQHLADFAGRHFDLPDSSMTYTIGQAGALPFPDASADVVQSISVLEHIPLAHDIVPELARVLAPQGSIVLTMDLALHGRDGMGVSALQSLLDALSEHFDLCHPTAQQIFHTALHDADTLTNFTSPKRIRRQERIGLQHSIREVDHWPPIRTGRFRSQSNQRALARAKSRKQSLLAIYAIKASKR